MKLSKNPAKNRVLIALDVIKQLRIRKFIPTSTYLSSTVSEKVERQRLDKCEDMSEFYGMSRCEVCAIGGLFVSSVLLFDNVSVTEHSSMYSGYYFQHLNKWFRREQLDKIESCYMNWTDFLYDENNYEIPGRLHWMKTEQITSKRLIKIMENIVKNKGEFIP